MRRERIVVFAGPSLLAEDRRAYPAVEFFPPVANGDIFRLVGNLPQHIGIIDGYFGDQLSVFHKEILWAMAQGARVCGAASMGALRAAELDVYGLVGIGAIYRAYRDGDLIEDDAVAVQHGPAELDYLATTVAIVDVQATVEALVADASVSQEQEECLLIAARAVHFSDRTWQEIERRAVRQCSGLTGIATTLSAAHVPSKRRDALELLRVITAEDMPAQRVECAGPPATPAFHAALRRATRGAPQR